MLFSRCDYAWSCRAESNNLNNFDTLKKKILLPHILYYQRNDNTFEYQLKSHNSEHNKRFHKKQIPKLPMSFGDGKI